jgi:hypothetical protein
MSVPVRHAGVGQDAQVALGPWVAARRHAAVIEPGDRRQLHKIPELTR